MDNLYHHINKYMIRIPLSPNSIAELQPDEQEQWLKNLCKNTLFREQILVSSKTLYDTMGIYLHSPDKLSTKKKRNFILSIAKYANRRSTRTTPFGLFSAVGVGSFASQHNCHFDQSTFYKKARVDLEWLFRCIQKIEKEYATHLSFKLNPACYVKGDRAFLLYSTDNESNEIHIRATPVFALLHQQCQQLTHFDQMSNILQAQYPDTPADRIHMYLTELIHKEFLISDLRPPLTINDQYQYVIDQLHKSSVDPLWLVQLQDIQSQIEVYNNLPLGEGEHLYIQLLQQMNQVMKSTSPLQVDLGLADEHITLDEQLAQTIPELANMLTRLAAPFSKQSTYLEEYKNKFIEKYGVDREIPLMEMLDTSSGIGAPVSYQQPQNDFYENVKLNDQYEASLKNFFLLKYWEAVKNKHAIQLNDQQLQDYLDQDVDHQEVPVSLELNFIVRQHDDNPVLHLGPNVGSILAGKTFGRFSHLSSQITDTLETVHQYELNIRNSNSTLCELSFVPNQMRSGNVTRNASYRHKEMSLFTNSSKSESESVRLEDIRIGIDQNTFYARDHKSGDIIVFESNNMLNPLMSSNAIRFLQEINEHGKRQWNKFVWVDLYQDFKYVPEIKYNDIILSSEQWYITQRDLEMTDKTDGKTFVEQFSQFQQKYDIPQQFYIANSDHRLFIDTHNQQTMDILFSEVKKIQSHALHLVAVEKDENLLKDQNEQSYVAEIVVPLVKITPEPTRIIPNRDMQTIDLHQRLKIPFDEWLFIKLYGKQSREEELIAFEMERFFTELNQSYDAKHFFMRYMDPKPHIRLRINSQTQQLLEIFPIILSWLQQLQQRDMISDFVIGSYDREIERYGGVELMSAAEYIFCMDSIVVEQLIGAVRTKQLDIEIELIAMISIIAYLEQAGLNFENQLSLIQRNTDHTRYRQEFKENKDKYLHMCNTDHNWEALRQTESGQTLLEMLEQRESAVTHYIQLMQQQPVVTPDLEEIISSIIHLHCNRLLGTDRELEYKIMNLVAHTLYAQRYQKTEGNLLWK
ncbi:lantibiotic dehydratase [Paenibacillus nicotianae]|uniref:Lantibiotic dehydratase n=1 Tax=Paenibacillus nicotianae TaxID=1526551 RepID=A0ABW4UYZ1_9BACL